MDTATLLGLLRSLAHAQAGPATLHLPAGLAPEKAIEAVRAAIMALEPTPGVRDQTEMSSGTVCVHIDGASRGNPGPAGIGVLFLGPDGASLGEIHRGIGEATNNVAEYTALLAALERAAAMGIRDLEVYSDSELLVRQLQGRYQVKHPALRPLYMKARKRITAFRHFAIHHVPRERNAAADALANRGIDEASKRSRHPQSALDRGESV